ncbi:efflux RND transporter periplasmic adaptor subunit [Fulvivirga sp. 29W222]|uniref:Efflux RND transporter periplasmic adaptor subunit n=1 Tax=Fulvivirga marina TaxID=2494733 RepID=A0A937FT75_9BACT|nr:efflux RND transporter periplasmic adaptor subunit [Fulvivirga marina]MBL6445255.1 efflux RND transporter periplasmic adaptor subunit [Fulvivirga marina]
MKTRIVLLFVAVSLLSACSNNENNSIESLLASGDLDKIKTKKGELTAQIRRMEKDLSLLDSVIDAKSTNHKLPLVTAYKIEKKTFQHYIELQGDVTTKQNVLVYPEVPGTLLKIYVTDGDKVSKGQLLATIDNGGMSSQLQQQKTQLALVKTTYERQKRLWEQKIGTEIQFLEAKARYEAQEDVVRQLQRQLDKYSIRAPFNGIVDDVIKDQGTVVSPGPGSEVFRVVNLSDMYINVDVPESHLTSVNVGKKVHVYFPVLNDTIDSKVRQAGNYINPMNRAFNVEVPIPNKKGQVKPNLSAKVFINDYTNEEAILIPQGIISENAEGEQYVYVATKINAENTAVAEKRIISTGKTQGELVEITNGLSIGESLVDEGARRVKAGQEVQIIKQ